MTVRKTTASKPTRKPATKAAPAKRIVRKGPAGGGDSRVVSLHNTNSLVPDKDMWKEYIDRQFNGVWVLDLMAHAQKHQENILQLGPTGCGKTMAGYAFASKHQLPIFAVNAHSGKTVEALMGRWIPDNKGGFTWVDGPVTHIVKVGGVLIFDEVNFLNEKIQSGTFSLLDKRRYVLLEDKQNEIVYAHPNLLVLATGNPGYQGTRDLNYAFKNRFAHKTVWDYDPKVESKLVTSKSLLELAKNIRERTVSGDFDTPTPTNMLMEFEKMALSLGIDYAVGNFISAYDDDERPSIKQLLDLAKKPIEDQLFPEKAAAKAKAVPDDLDAAMADFSIDDTCASCGAVYDITLSACPVCGN